MTNRAGSSIHQITYGNGAASRVPTVTSSYVPRVIDVVGSANEAASVVVEGDPASGREGRLFFHQVDFSGEPDASDAQWREVEITGTLTGGGFNDADRVASETRHAYVLESPVVDQHDADGNLIQDERWRYTWNAENRLIAMETRSEIVEPLGPLPASERRRLELVYDSTGRRIEKRGLEWSSGQWSVVSETRFLYDGWNMVAEFSAQPSAFSLLRSYAWGLDVSGTLQGAGGVGGLVAVTHDPDLPSAISYIPTYDGNGNITELIRASDGAMVAEYEYGPFGELIVASGNTELSPFTFSTKYTDEESGLVYYGYRYYNPSMGRWLNRDPIEENGGISLHAMLSNDPVNTFDPFGLRRGNVVIDADVVARLKILTVALQSLDEVRNECACYPSIVRGVDEFEKALLDRRAFREFFDRVGEGQKLLKVADKVGDSAVAFNFVRDLFGVEFVNQGSLEDARRLNRSVHRVTKTVRDIYKYGELISERDAFDVLAATIEIGFERGLNRVPKAGIFPLYHADAVRGIGRAWQDGGISKLPDLAGRIVASCDLGEEEAEEALKNMKNFNGVGLWKRWWNAVTEK